MFLNRIMPSLVILVLALIPPPTTSKSILSEKKLKEFYATGGKACVNCNVHIHLDASILGKKPKNTRLPGGQILLEYRNRSVPILVNARNVYYRRLKMKKKVTGLLCLKGYVYRPKWDLKGRCFLRVKVIKTYGGRLTKN
jgi:hypothetical protein